MADAGNKWYVLKAVSGKEAKVKEYIEAEMKHNDLLAANVSQVLIPVEKHATVRNGKRVVKEIENCTVLKMRQYVGTHAAPASAALIFWAFGRGQV